MDTIEYLYGVTADTLKSNQDKVIAGEALLHKLIGVKPIDVKRLKDVAERFNHNNKVLKGGI